MARMRIWTLESAAPTFAKISDVESGLTRLRGDLADGTWELRSQGQSNYPSRCSRVTWLRPRIETFVGAPTDRSSTENRALLSTGLPYVGRAMSRDELRVAVHSSTWTLTLTEETTAMKIPILHLSHGLVSHAQRRAGPRRSTPPGRRSSGRASLASNNLLSRPRPLSTCRAVIMNAVRWMSHFIPYMSISRSLPGMSSPSNNRVL